MAMREIEGKMRKKRKNDEGNNMKSMRVHSQEYIYEHTATVPNTKNTQVFGSTAALIPCKHRYLLFPCARICELKQIQMGQCVRVPQSILYLGICALFIIIICLAVVFFPFFCCY